jgi:hypothetical protein
LMGIPVYVYFFGIHKTGIQKRVLNYLQKNGLRRLGLITFGLMSLVLGAFFSLLITPILNTFKVGRQFYVWSEYTLCFEIMFFVFMAAAVIHVKEMVRLEEEVALEHTRQFELLRGRINPHFIFNALTNIKIYSENYPERTPELIGHLATLFRYTTDNIRKDFVPIQDEIEFLENYVALERLQMDTRTQLVFQVPQRDPSVSGMIAPMILLNFIENCFKHFNKKSTGKRHIFIDIDVTDDRLELTTRNSFDPSFNPNTEGVLEPEHWGYLDAIAYLNQAYPDAYKLVKQEDLMTNEYCLTLILPLKHA